jgi:hypothetical protein
MQKIAILVQFACALLASSEARKEDPEYEYVTIGSSLKLTPISSPTFRLHSHDINWGSGSGQQSVTAFPGDGDTNSLWLVTAQFGTAVRSGTPVKCGEPVRLKHVRTHNFLHSHLHQSPLSGQQEVSCYNGGNTDTGDNWRVVCTGDNDSDHWKRGAQVMFQHVDTGKYLSTDVQAKFNQQNCRNCPIQGQLEVRASAGRSRMAMWKTTEGFFFPVTEEHRNIIPAEAEA